MQILTKKKLRFRGGAEVFVSMGGNNIQAAPDWIEKDPLFPLAVKDGSLVKLAQAPIVQGSNSGENDPAEEKAAEEKAAEEKTAPKKTAAKKK